MSAIIRSKRMDSMVLQSLVSNQMIHTSPDSGIRNPGLHIRCGCMIIMKSHREERILK